MNLSRFLIAGYGFKVGAAYFDGVNDYISRVGFVGAADSKSGIFSAWIRLDRENGYDQLILGNDTISNSRFLVLWEPSGILRITGMGTDVNEKLAIQTGGIYQSGPSFIHILASWNLASAGSGRLYINDVTDYDEQTYTNADIDYTPFSNAWTIGGDQGAGNKSGITIAELYFAPGQYLDFSVTANRRKFISPNLRPVPLGADGSIPTGSAPIAYQRLSSIDSVSSFATNRGTGGNFTITGTLSTPPETPTHTNPTPFLVGSADFDGTNDYMDRATVLSGVNDSKTGILSFWVRFDGGDGNVHSILMGSGTKFSLSKGSVGWIELSAAHSGGGSAINIRTSNTYSAGATWRHVLMSWDLAVGATHVYVNDASDRVTSVANNIELDLTDANWYVGAEGTGNNKLDGCLAEVYFAPGNYLDFSVTANRRKFISATGKPVYLGFRGNLPTGATPAIYLQLYANDDGRNLKLNRGSGGVFSITGLLQGVGSSSPSD